MGRPKKIKIKIKIVIFVFKMPYSLIKTPTASG
jgi:hypothetical protein